MDRRNFNVKVVQLLQNFRETVPKHLVIERDLDLVIIAAGRHIERILKCQIKLDFRILVPVNQVNNFDTELITCTW